MPIKPLNSNPIRVAGGTIHVGPAPRYSLWERSIALIQTFIRKIFPMEPTFIQHNPVPAKAMANNPDEKRIEALILSFRKERQNQKEEDRQRDAEVQSKVKAIDESFQFMLRAGLPFKKIKSPRRGPLAEFAECAQYSYRTAQQDRRILVAGYMADSDGDPYFLKIFSINRSYFLLPIWSVHCLQTTAFPDHNKLVESIVAAVISATTP